MHHYTTLSDYCEAIHIAPPKHDHFDIRRFEDNMATVRSRMPTFRHEFYAIAIRVAGRGTAKTGPFEHADRGSTVFFNTPFQMQSWDIAPNWTGFYVMFSIDFMARSRILTDVLADFPFLKIDQSIPLDVPLRTREELMTIYRAIWDECQGSASDKFSIIEAQVYLLLCHIRRLFYQQVDATIAQQYIKAADLRLLARYQTLIQTSFYPDAMIDTRLSLHSTKYYAQKLSVHPNHLNATVKSVSGITALNHIHRHLLSLAKTYLAQTELTVKEIAYKLHFDTPNAFSAFFKRKVDLTPLQYRASRDL